MSATFLTASSQGLETGAGVITGFPCSMGMWVYPTTTGAQKCFAMVGGSSSTDFLQLSQSAANAWEIGGATTISLSLVSAGVVTANQWAYVVGRWISATNRRLSVLQFDGSTAFAQDTVSRATVPPGNINIGRRHGNGIDIWFSGLVAEFWVTNSDIQADGAQLQDSTLRQLARDGPFSVPHILKDIVDYRSLRYAMGSDQDIQPDYYLGNKGRQTWTNINGVTRGVHPPLSRPDPLIRPWMTSYPDAPVAASSKRTQIYMYG